MHEETLAEDSPTYQFIFGRFATRRVFPHNRPMPNTFGHLFRITTWGESHGGGVGVVLDGCPPQLELDESDIQPDLDRRRPGQSKIVTPRDEADRVSICLLYTSPSPRDS